MRSTPNQNLDCNFQAKVSCPLPLPKFQSETSDLYETPLQRVTMVSNYWQVENKVQLNKCNLIK